MYLGISAVVVATVVDLTVGDVDTVVVIVVGALKANFGLKGSLLGGNGGGGGGGAGLLDLIGFLIFFGLSGTGAVRESNSS